MEQGAPRQNDRRFPPFAETIGRVVLPASSTPSAFDATIAHPSMNDASAAASLTASLSQEVLQDMRVIELLGAGGMGQVHLAEQRSLGREVALKTVHDGSAPSAVAALCEEALVTGQIEHPSVIPVHALGRSADGRPVMVMKRVEGVSWKELLASPEHPHWENISGEHGLVAHLEILTKVCHAVAFAHSRGIAHRDLKPENVMIGRFGEVYVVDWGLAVRLPHHAPPEGAPPPIVGTPAYMAPEMVIGRSVDERTDVYLLGAILHELLTGDAPHGGETLMAVLAEAYVSAPKSYGADVPAELVSLCRDAMSQDPDERPSSVRAFRDRLVAHLQHRASIAMARRGHERLEALSGEGLTAADARLAVRQGLIECRFAFLQALDEWADNESAQRGMRLCSEQAVRVEVADGQAAAARAALDVLDGPPAELVQAVQDLEARTARDREEAERLRRLAHDNDASVGGRARRRVMFLLAATATAVGVGVAMWRETSELVPWDIARVAGVMLVCVSATLGLLRRRLLRNAFSRKVAYLALFAAVAMFVHRVLGALADQQVAVILATDTLLFTVFFVTAGIALLPRLAVGAPFTFAGAAVSLLHPDWAAAAFSTSIVLAVITTALVLRYEQDETQPD
jgi:eukaryotic-like serine/threonine-protein kinase